MYSVILAVALTSGEATPAFFHKHHHQKAAPAAPASCYGCAGCYGCVGCYGCAGCYGGCHGHHGLGHHLHVAFHGPWGFQGAGVESAVPVGPPIGPHGYLGYYGSPEGAFNCAGFGGCYGTCDGGCYGVGNSWKNAVPVQPFVPGTPGGVLPTPTTGPEQIKEPPTEINRKETGLPNGAARARLVLDVPEDARLFVDGQATKATSAVRSFRTPELAPGEEYYYNVRVEVDVDGKTAVQNRRVVVRAGEVIRQQFDDPRVVKTVAGKR